MCRLGTVGWGAHSPRYDDDDAAAVLGAIVVIVAAIVVGNTATAVADGTDGVVVVVVLVTVGRGTGRYHNCSTFDATTVTLSCISLAFS